MDQKPRTEQDRAQFGIVLATGGTGGHYYPAVALAQALRSLAPDLPVLLIGTTDDRGILEDELPDGVSRLEVPVPRRGRALATTARYMLGTAEAFTEVRRALARFARRGLVVAFGGYASVGVAIAARSLGWQLVLFEPNVVPGRANRCLVAFADLVCAGTPETIRRLNPRCPAVVTGIPVRAQIVRASMLRRAGRQPTGLGPVIATVGGSQGARSLNDATVALAEILAERRVWIVHQTGSLDWPRIRWTYAERSLNVLAVEFIADMGELYRSADVLLMRAGASAIAEAAVCDVAAVLVPYPHADGHQEQNAIYAAERLGWRIVREDPAGRIDPDLLHTSVMELLPEAAERRGTTELAELHRLAAGRFAEQILRRCA